MKIFRFPRFFSPASREVFSRLDGVFRIAIIRNDHIGDLVYTLPLAKVFNGFDVEVHFFVSDYTLPLAQQYTLHDPMRIKAHSLDVLADAIDKFQFNVMIFPNAKTTPLFRKETKATKKYRTLIITRAQLIQNLFLADRLLYLPEMIKYSLHEAQINMALLQPILGNMTAQLKLNQIDTQIPPPDLHLAVFDSSAWCDAKFRLIIHLGSNGNGRHWSLKNFVEVINELEQEQVDIWLTGSQKEGNVIKAQIPEVFDMLHVHPIFGQHNLLELMSFIHRADGLIANGTGPLHLAGALGIRTLGLFPHAWRIGAERWRPLSKFARTLSATSCEKKCTKSCRCIEQVFVRQVLDVVKQWLKNPKEVLTKLK